MFDYRLEEDASRFAVFYENETWIHRQWFCQKPGEEKEVLPQLYAYCGFPRSMGALVTLMNLTKERAAQGIKDEAGREPSPVKSSDMFVGG